MTETSERDGRAGAEGRGVRRQERGHEAILVSDPGASMISSSFGYAHWIDTFVGSHPCYRTRT